jgi:hypothetical protein
MLHMNEICWAFQENPVPSERQTDVLSRASFFFPFFVQIPVKILLTNLIYKTFLMQIQHEY